jgi:hypothetical protein
LRSLGTAIGAILLATLPALESALEDLGGLKFRSQLFRIKGRLTQRLVKYQEKSGTENNVVCCIRRLSLQGLIAAAGGSWVP